MHKFFIKIPWIIRKIFYRYTWKMPPETDKSVYLTFDDGPHPQITPWVLDLLKKYNAEATFFCIGNNVVQYPEVYKRILEEQHATGNHTYNHLNGWKTPVQEYISDIARAAGFIQSNLFRPPYGRIRKAQASQINEAMQSENAKIIMWDILTGDFDKNLSPEQCLHNLTHNVRDGSIIVFHDSEKAFANLKIVLPEALKFLKNRGYILKKIKL